MKKPNLSIVKSAPKKTPTELRAEKYVNLKKLYESKTPDIDVKYFKLPITGDVSVYVSDKKTGLPLFSAMMEPIGDKESPSSYKLAEVRKPYFKDSENFIATPDVINKAMQQAQKDHSTPIVIGERRSGSRSIPGFEQIDFAKDLDIPKTNIENIGTPRTKTPSFEQIPMKMNVDDTLLQRIEKLKESEVGRPKMSLEDVDIVEYPGHDSFNINKKGTDQWIGNFQARPARIYIPETKRYVEIPEFITMDAPYLEHPYRRRGLGEQMYKKMEEYTGKKLMPDVELTDYSAALHTKKGLGKSFGKAEYKDDIIKSLVKSLNKLGLAEPEKIAEKAYTKLRDTIRSKGVKEFKSVAPLLVKGALVKGALEKGATAAGAGLLSLAAEAADATEEGSELEEAAMMREREQQKFRETVGEDVANKLEENMQKLGPKDLLFKKLKDKLR